MQLLFCPDAATLRRRWPGAVARSTQRGAVWIAGACPANRRPAEAGRGFAGEEQPKRASGVPTDVTEDTVRAHALPQGWVDVKVCAVDATWSGLKLVRRRER